MHKILIVEDDDAITGAIRDLMERWGYQAACITDFRDIMPEFLRFDPQLVLIDIYLPFFNGYHWCSKIRSVSSVPVIFISSVSDNMNIVMAMNMGGDDFIVKPFDPEVLAAKVRAMLRRTYDFSGKSDIVEHRGVVFNSDNGTIAYKDIQLELSRNERIILKTLMENKGRTVSRDELMLRLWETDSFVDDNTLAVNVARLRRKLDEIGVRDFIKTRRGSGYLVE